MTNAEQNAAIPIPQFEVGQSVTMPGFTDCFGKVHPTVTGLTVTSVKLFDAGKCCEHHMKPYYRITAHYPDGYQYHEGAERFFTAV